ncbi:molybdopterin-dependent oxidoreductase [Emticicia sp. CRIBPO]|uniref:xanthine dehydrogenase family protein molybdopterin-binding subunit n=1 Tax=Emticicia sp. CRIBPO TaxID=2683258 RepID=UPI001412F9F1|nr:molybdopterin cofactor-binding domain-containing protein [Emticicia sp. CRIBPO]NBA85945.1 molybdopterin-dependent oxidoreductase [Emticicia sp. CRIBPO]
MATENKKTFSRRKFFQRSAIVLGGVVVATYAAKGVIRRFIAETAEGMDMPSMLANNEALLWFEILPDNTVLMKSPKIEMGQGIFTGFAMLAAEELEMPLDRIKVEHASTSNGPIDKVSTGGSNSTSSLYVTIREVAATMREMLKIAAAKQWGIKPSEVKAHNGELSSGNRKITYAALAAGTKDWEVPEIPALKPASEFRFVGKDFKRIDLKQKVLGKPIFGIDQTFPGMLYGAILQSPYIGGKLKSVKTDLAAQSPGVVKVIHEDDLVAVVAKSRYAAQTALEKMEAQWDVPKKWQQDEFVALTKVGTGTRVNVQNEGSAESAIKDHPEEVFKQEYRTPMAVHAHMEPNGSVVHAEENKATVWTGTQAPDMVRGAVSSALGLGKDEVNLKVAFSGGGFGRRMDLLQPQNVARISKIVGQPVHVFNTREQEFMNGVFRPQTHHVLAAKMNKNGEVEAITHDQATPDQIFSMAPENVGAFFLGADFISAGHGASIMYNVKNKSTSVWHQQLPVTTGIWRSVGIFPNTFAIESFMNELAHKTGKDPIALRMDLLKGSEKINKRYQKVLEVLAEKSGWDKTKPEGTGRGVAICNDRKTIAAAVAEVEIIDGMIKVRKITQVIDPGMVINPEGIRMQVEGATMMGLTATLYEEIKVKDGQIASSNFHEYPMVTLADTPEIEVVIVQGHDEPYGVGEPPMGPVAPAIGGAILQLTGKAVRSLPIRLS